MTPEIGPVQIGHLLRRYSLGRVTGVEPLANAGGFSGASLWRIDADGNRYCLRRWPTTITRDRLRFIHEVLRHVSANGCAVVAAPLPDVEGNTITNGNGSYWELSQWLPGVASFKSNPNDMKLGNAIVTLANFHLAAATCPGHEQHVRPSSAVKERIEMIQQLKERQLQVIADRLGTVDWPDLDMRARQLLQRFSDESQSLARRLSRLRDLPVPVQGCIRDVWHDHVLFTGDEVTGLVDFGAMRIESVAVDIARLIGSLINDVQRWQFAIEAYMSLRPLLPAEVELVHAFHDSFRVLAGMNWLKWIYLQRKTFADPAGVIKRIDAILSSRKSGTFGERE